MFNIYLQSKDSDLLPSDDICYIITKNGPMMKKKIGIMESLIPVKSISILGDITPYAKMNIPKIERKEFSHIINFFKEVYKKYKSEANVIVHYNDKIKKFIMQIPYQKVTGGSVTYENNVQFKGYNRIGTIHSHASMHAFHSGTDNDDENGWDGFHFTLGKLNQDKIEISTSIVINGKRFETDPLDYIEGLELDNKITSNYYKNFKSYGNLEENNYYIPGGNKFSYPKDWMKFIDKETFESHKKKYNLLLESKNIKYKNPMFENIGFGFMNIDNEDYKNYNPCEICPHRENKVDLMLEEKYMEEEEMNDDFKDVLFDSDGKNK